ncbi:MHS family MFS transporter [Caballeronia sp. LjRoot34]|uniref:MFS transporter n=1 Tax=Caballeronia sp. LjRoot34 TaxID=3342325 RepID=UPI003ED0E37D
MEDEQSNSRMESEPAFNAMVLSGAAPTPKSVLVAATVGTTLEYYDFIVYGTVAALALGRIFFPTASHGAGVLLALSTFAVGFIARPLGAILFGHLGDRIGRRQTLLLTFILMGAATFFMGFLPTFEQVGILAPLALIGLRFIQGAAMGGEWGGAAALTGEHSADTRRGRATSFVAMGSPLGLLLANGVMASIAAGLTSADFIDWGWRIPFLLSLFLLPVGIYLRVSVPETPVFQELRRKSRIARAPLLTTLSTHRRRLLIAIGMTAVSFSGYYTFTIVGLAYLAARQTPPTLGLDGTIIGGALSVPVIVMSGIASDIWGRRPLYALSAVAIGVWGFAFFPLLDTGRPIPIAIGMAVGLVCASILHGVQGAFLSELFPAEVRYTGASLAYHLTGALGGLIPVTSIWLFQKFGTTIPISIFVAATAFASLLAIAAAPETARTMRCLRFSRKPSA